MHEDRSPRTIAKNVATALAVWLSILLTVRAFASGSVAPAITPPDLEREIAARVLRVEEFQAIREWAEKTGTKIYLFGGTAAGFAHYVKSDVERERGDKTYQSEYFDYDYTNIYRSTQDLDIVLDGNETQAKDLESFLMNRYAYMKGGKSKWEVRLLREKRGEKIPLLANPDFLNQHTDSNSTGMIELSKASGSVVRDLRDWDAREPFFLRDVSEGKIHYYDSALHHTTSHFKAGENPPIISVIRYLTKAFQYELEMRPEDLAIVKRRIEEFSPANDLKNSRASSWIEKNAGKLVQNAVNIEYAIDTLDALGLRAKLVALGDPTRVQSTAWWLSKEPLRTKALGRTGQTARELKLDVVAHETSSFLAYESITRSKQGSTNALISRSHAPGEAAMFGDGFYTRVGREGARGTKITIRFRLNPDARLGEDFTMSGDYVVVKNKAALRVIPESLNIGAVDFLVLVTGPDFESMKEERALMEKLRRRLLKWKSTELTKQERGQISQLIRPGGPLEKFITEQKSSRELGWIFSFLTGTEFEPWLRAQIQRKTGIPAYWRMELYMNLGWKPEMQDLLGSFQAVGKGNSSSYDHSLIAKAVFENHDGPELKRLVSAYADGLLEGMANRHVGYPTFEEFWQRLETEPRAKEWKLEVAERFLLARESKAISPGFDFYFVRMAFANFEKAEALKFADRILAFERPQDSALRTMVEAWGLELGPRRIDKMVEILERGNFTIESSKESFFRALVELGDKMAPGTVDGWLTRLGRQQNWSHEIGTLIAHKGIDAYPRTIALFFARQMDQTTTATVMRSLSLTGPTRPEFWKKALEDYRTTSFDKFWLGYFMNAFHGPGWTRHPEIVRKYMEIHPNIASFLFSSHQWATEQPQFITSALKKSLVGGQYVSHIDVKNLFMRPESARHPEWIEAYVLHQSYIKTYMDEVFAQEHWAKHPLLLEVIRLSGGWNRFKGVTHESLKHAFDTKLVTLEKAQASLDARNKSGGVMQKLLGPLRRAAPVQCHSIFGAR